MTVALLQAQFERLLCQVNRLGIVAALGVDPRQVIERGRTPAGIGLLARKLEAVLQICNS